MGKYDDVSARPEWARGELAPGTLCASKSGHYSRPMKAVAVVTEWFGNTSEGKESYFFTFPLPYPVCARHLTKLVRAWKAQSLQQERRKKEEGSARELKAALEYFRETTGVALDAGLTEKWGTYVFTLDATQLRHLAHAMDDTLAPGGPNMDEDGKWREPPLEAPPGPAETKLAEVLQFPGGRY
jgi:hypothetical protein